MKKKKKKEKVVKLISVTFIPHEARKKKPSS